MSHPLVSVVIPTYNYGRYVVQAVESALEQSYPNVEVIVVDDGSIDDTSTRLDPYKNRIHYIYQANAGLSAARNTGIRAAKGSFIAFLDSDDLFHPRKLEIQMAFFEAHPEIGLLGTGSFSDEKVVWADVAPQTSKLLSLTTADVILKTRFVASSTLARSGCFPVVGLFDPELRSVEDRDMWIRIAAQFPIAAVEEPLTWYRITPGSMSHNPEKMEHFELLVINRVFGRPEFAGQRRLRRRAIALAYFSSAYVYSAANRQWRAINRVILSMLWYPYLSRKDVRMSCARPRLLLATFLRLLKLRPAIQG